MWMSSLVLTIQLLGYLILTHTQITDWFFCNFQNFQKTKKWQTNRRNKKASTWNQQPTWWRFLGRSPRRSDLKRFNQITAHGLISYYWWYLMVIFIYSQFPLTNEARIFCWSQPDVHAIYGEDAVVGSITSELTRSSSRLFLIDKSDWTNICSRSKEHINYLLVNQSSTIKVKQTIWNKVVVLFPVVGNYSLGDSWSLPLVYR